MVSSAIEMRSPAVSSMSISRPPGCAATSCARRTRSSVCLAHRRDDDHHVVAGSAGAHDVVGHRLDAVGVGDRRPAELLDEQGHGEPGYRGPGPAPEELWPHGRFMRCAQCRQAPAKEGERAMAREAREAAVRRRKRMRTARNFGIIAVLFVGTILVFNHFSSSSKKNAATPTTTVSTPTTVKPVAYPAGCVKTTPPTTKKPTFKSAPPMTIDPTKTYVAHFTTTCGNFDIALDAKNAPKSVNNFVFLARQGFFDGLKFHRVANDSSCKAVTRWIAASATRDTKQSSSCHRTGVSAGRSGVGEGKRPRRERVVAVLHRHRRRVAASVRTTGTSARSATASPTCRRWPRSSTRLTPTAYPNCRSTCSR